MSGHNQSAGSQTATSVPVSPARHDESSVPRPVLIATGCLLLMAMAFAFVARQTDIGATRLAPAPAVEARDLAVTLDEAGATVLRDATSGAILERLPATSDGFSKIVLRTVAHQRKLANVAADSPMRLSRLTDGQLTLTDPSTGRIWVLSAFGPGNADVFGRLLSR
jgi:putative photosynthetic complex assembly protein